MAEAAMRCGYEYLAITDHTQHLTVARGLDKKRLLQQIKEIERLNGRFRKFRILRGSEVDILEDGSLDLPDEILKELDVRVCSIHYRFELSEKKQTERVIRAMDNPYFNILGHPTGRLLDRRRPYELNLEQVMKAAKERGCFMEINAQPERMDLNDLHCLAAKAHGVKLVISTDAHSDFDLNYMRYGVAQARRGWLEAPDVINTLPLSKLLPLFKR
jgi:DNA polymerase (family 10)